ncbi:hypothetical protein C7B80_32695 [Cyanosarcina cf. burmensis CCALA 770]|nr:hypothetical protein C7B80_32695 [Cyanosarcina cf. burmensis CCALA 770]
MLHSQAVSSALGLIILLFITTRPPTDRTAAIALLDTDKSSCSVNAVDAIRCSSLALPRCLLPATAARSHATVKVAIQLHR